MDTETLKTVHSHQLHIAEEIKRICDKYDIKYFLDRGTLLGIVRHRGFIPWDCNFCIGMLRKDYDFFLKKAMDELDDTYYLQNYNTEKYFGDNISRVGLRGTVFKDRSSSNRLDNEGVNVTIFVYDVYPDDVKKQKLKNKKLDKYLNLLLAKTYFLPWNKNERNIKRFSRKIVFTVYRFLYLVVSKEKLIQKYEQELISDEISGYYFSHNSKSSYKSYVISKECFDELIELSFEGIDFLCPGDCDLFLKELYGDYAILPPEEERVAGLEFVNVKL